MRAKKSGRRREWGTPAGLALVVSTGLLAAPPTAPAAAHQIMTSAGVMDFTNLESPTGKMCCGNKDCLPAEVRLNEATGELEVLAAGKWWPALDPRWFVGPTPDGSWFACAYHGELRCTLGGVGT